MSDQHQGGPRENHPTAVSRVRRLPILQGVLPIDKARIPVETLAGVTLAALAIPEVMGYTTIAGMPVITGLYTILIPIILFAVLGSSRHLVVGADSATAAVMAAGLVGVAVTGSKEYVALAGVLAIMAGVFLVLARIIGLGFLADFLSRTVLVGFLTGVGIQVACGQVGGVLGIPEGPGVTIHGHRFGGTISKLASTLQHISNTSLATVAVSAGVLIVILGGKYVIKSIPAALIAVVGSIIISWHWTLVSHGVTTLGPVPGGLPHLGLPHVGWAESVKLLGTAASIFILILAQSAATSRAYAARRNEVLDENLDLVGLGVANLGAAISGGFVVNGSPTKTQMVDSAGGKTQLAQITTGIIVGIVLLFLTVPIQYLPKAVLASVVLLIGIELVDLGGMRSILRMRPDEFVVATLTAATVIVIGVEQGILLAIVASVVIHLRRSYRPQTMVVVREPGRRGWHGVPVAPNARTVPGLVVCGFASGIYYANANHLLETVATFIGTDSTEPLECFCLDAVAISDIDVTGAQVLRQIHTELAERHVRFVISTVLHRVKVQLKRYGLIDLLGQDAIYETVKEAVQAFESGPHPPLASAPGPDGKPTSDES